MWGGSTAPTGYLECNGQSTSGYTALSAVVGDNVPDLRDRFIVGAGSGYAVNATGGRADSVMHNHIHGFVTNPGGAHNHFDNGPGAPVTQAGLDVDGNGAPPRVDINDGPPFEGIVWNISEGDHQHSGITAGSDTNPIYVGGVGAALVNDSRITNLPPYYALVYMIKT